MEGKGRGDKKKERGWRGRDGREKSKNEGEGIMGIDEGARKGQKTKGECIGVASYGAPGHVLPSTSN